MPKIVFSERFLGHKTVNHPESRERLESVLNFLLEHDWNVFERPVDISEEELFLVHSKELVEKIKLLSKKGEVAGDNFFNSDTFEIALLACGSALAAARLCKKEFAFSIARPPGHHAGRNFFGGFCYFNNIAFAVRKIMQERELQRAMIVDFDMHHGNGTQNIFLDDEKVFFLSLHQNPEYTFPGTGKAEENNFHIRNVPLESGITEEEYLKIFREKFSECFSDFKPEIIGVSAGFDILSSNKGVGNRMNIESTGIFGQLAGIIAEAKCPCFAVLEGGYTVETLGSSVFNFIKGFE